MKKLFSAILVLGVILGTGWSCSQFELISSKEMVKELRDSDSKRLKAWGYLIEISIIALPLWDWFNLDEDEEFRAKIMLKIENDPEVRGYFIAGPEERKGPNIEEMPLDKNFEFSEFEEEFNKLKSILIRIISYIQESLDLSWEMHEKVLKESTKVLKIIENFDFLMNQELPQYKKDYIRAHHVFSFIGSWAGECSVSLDEETINEITVIGEFLQKYLSDKSVDQNSEEFKKTFSEYMEKLNEKLDELIRFIETLD